MSDLTPNSRLSVFVVEDSPIVLDRLVESLSEIEGVRVVGSARDLGSAALAINRLEPDVVTLDLQLGSDTGWDLLDKLTCQPHVFVLSNFTDPWSRKRGEQLRVAKFFDKSQEFGTFLQAVRELTV